MVLKSRIYRLNILKCFYIIILFCSFTGCSSKYVQQKRSLVTKIALQQVGISYVRGGDSPSKGFDCSGLVYYSYKCAGYSIPRTVNRQLKHGSKILFTTKPGDLLFFNTNQKWWNPWSWNQVTHVGIYLGNDKMIHAPKQGSKVCVVNRVSRNRYWKKYYKSRRRII